MPRVRSSDGARGGWPSAEQPRRIRRGSRKSLPPRAASYRPIGPRIRQVDARHRSQEHPLLPHVLNNVFARNRAEFTARENLRDGAYPLRQLAVAFAECERLRRLQLDRLAISLSVTTIAQRPPSTRSRPNLASRISRCRMPLSIGMIAVCLPDRGREGFDRILEVERLATQQTTSNFSVSLSACTAGGFSASRRRSGS